jgi:hypothetical protein
MADVENQIFQWIKEIEPAPHQKAGAKRSQNYLRDVLCTGQMGERIISEYLSGSYSRQTAIYPLDDVDIIFVIRPEKFVRGIIARALGLHPDPKAILASFAGAIRYRYPDSSVRVQRRSVGLRLFHLDIDVVPAIKDDIDPDIIFIPDRNVGEWIKTAPKKHGSIAAEVNAARGQRFKPLVKLMKSWNFALPMNAQLKSFAIETIAARLFRQNNFESYEEGALLFLDFLAHLASQARAFKWKQTYGMSMNIWDTRVPDIAGTGSNVVSGVDAARQKRFLESAIKSRNLLLDARSEKNPSRANLLAKRALRMY